MVAGPPARAAADPPQRPARRSVAAGRRPSPRGRPRPRQQRPAQQSGLGTDGRRRAPTAGPPHPQPPGPAARPRAVARPEGGEAGPPGDLHRPSGRGPLPVAAADRRADRGGRQPDRARPRRTAGPAHRARRPRPGRGHAGGPRRRSARAVEGPGRPGAGHGRGGRAPPDGHGPLRRGAHRGPGGGIRRRGRRPRRVARRRRPRALPRPPPTSSCTAPSNPSRSVGSWRRRWPPVGR